MKQILKERKSKKQGYVFYTGVEMKSRKINMIYWSHAKET